MGWGAGWGGFGGPSISPFDGLRTGPSTGSGQALRRAQDRPFDGLRTGPSTGSGQALRRAQDRLRTNGGARVCGGVRARVGAGLGVLRFPSGQALRKGKGLLWLAPVPLSPWERVGVRVKTPGRKIPACAGMTGWGALRFPSGRTGGPGYVVVFVRGNDWLGRGGPSRTSG